jgi:cephalosporin hydroxylase
MKDVSVIIPARNEKYLEPTIRNVLANIRGNSEIIVVLDGYLPEPQIVTNDDRVRFIHNPVAIGQRQAINQAAREAQGKYFMKLDAHCAVDEGFDVKLMADCEPDWTVIPRMYNLDIDTFTPKRHKITDYMYIGCDDGRLLRAEYYRGGEYGKWHTRKELIDDTMCCMGPCFFMHMARFWELEGCDERHGGWGQQGVEVACKAWLSGGRLVVNKKTWFAHWFRGGSGPGFPYKLTGSDVEKARTHSRDLWLNDKWPKQARKFQWLVDKFAPPGWEKPPEAPDAQPEESNTNDLNRFFHKHIHIQRREPVWHGARIIKMPTDLMLYAEVIFDKKPDFIIDSGTKFGGSALFFQDILDLVGRGGKVITIDKYPVQKTKDPRIMYLEGGSTSDDVLAMVTNTVGAGSVMVVLDSDHSRRHVKRELHCYAPIVTSGQYMVVEDCFDRYAQKAGPGEAKDWFLSVNKEFTQTNLDQRYLIGFCREGWLIKK